MKSRDADELQAFCYWCVLCRRCEARRVVGFFTFVVDGEHVDLYLIDEGGDEDKGCVDVGGGVDCALGPSVNDEVQALAFLLSLG